MKRKVSKLIGVLMLISLASFGQKDSCIYVGSGLIVLNNEVRYDTIQKVEGATASTLYKVARTFFGDRLRNSKRALDIDDNINFQIAGKFSKLIQWKARGLFYDPKAKNLGLKDWGPYINLEYKVKINCKDGRYRVEIYDISNTEAWALAMMPKKYTLASGNLLDLASMFNAKDFEFRQKNWFEQKAFYDEVYRDISRHFEGLIRDLGNEMKNAKEW